MAILTINNTKVAPSALIDYIERDKVVNEKGEEVKKAVIITRHNLLPKISVAKQFINTALLKGKLPRLDDRKAYHLIISPSPRDNITPELCHELALSCMERYIKEVFKQQFQYEISIHDNTELPHAHIAVNAYSPTGGNKLSILNSDKKKMKAILNEECKKRNYEVYTDKFGINDRRVSRREYFLEKKGKVKKSEKEFIMDIIDEAKALSISMEEFYIYLENEAIVSTVSESRNDLAFITSGLKHPVRAKRLGKEYSEEAIRKAVEYNASLSPIEFYAQAKRIKSKKEKDIEKTEKWYNN